HVFCIGLSAGLADAVRAELPGATVVSINGSGAPADVVYDMSRKVANALGDRVDAIGGDISEATGIVTIGSNFPDAIGVSPLACSELWPIILTDKAAGTPPPALHASATATFSDLGITKAIKVGTYSVDAPGVTGLANLSGADRYYTNANVAAWAEANADLTFTRTAFTTGDKFPDALAAGPFVCRDGGSLLLTSSAGGVPDPVVTVAQAHAADMETLDFIGLPEDAIWLVSAVTPPVNPPFTPQLGMGSVSPAVIWLEWKLTGLTYRPDFPLLSVPGEFDKYTYSGVVAFQKYQGLARDGIMDPADWAALATATRPVATVATTGTWAEVDKTRQVLLWVVDGTVTKTLHVSTGSPDVGVETPEGAFTISKKVPGWVNGMYNLCVFANVPPIGDLGIHGYNTVPTVPASHGCVRTDVWEQTELYPQIPLEFRLFIYSSSL
ncbi:MAG: cell wall-binding repeat-containing protein, partial [Thermoleophilia bacterium]|nr:cell wall-binding repeat-containing protein [Thermoleophilia bacterium]